MSYPINREWAMPNKHTFLVKPIRELVNRYVGDGKGWVDLFSGWNSPAEVTNDLNPEIPAQYHLDAFDFVNTLDGKFKGCIFDPPYSLVQVSRSYKDIGLKSHIGSDDPTASFKIVKDKMVCHIEAGGYIISCGWNSNGFGMKRGFEIVEILLVAHGGGHNDTIIMVEQLVRDVDLGELERIANRMKPKTFMDIL